MPTLEERIAALEMVVAELTGAVRETLAPLKELVETLRPIPTHLVSLTENQRELTGTVAELTGTVRTLIQAQLRIEQELQTLATRLTEFQARTEECLSNFEEAISRLTEAQARTERRVDSLDARLGRLSGRELERTYRERAPAYFNRILNRIRVVGSQQLGSLLDDAVEAGQISPDGRSDILLADVVATGRRGGEDVYLVVEVSPTIDAQDVERAKRRATLLEKATSRRAIPAVAGEDLSADPDTRREARTVWLVLDGWAEPPEE